MRHVLILAVTALAAMSLNAPALRADTCWETAQVNIDCSPKTRSDAGSQAKGPSAQDTQTLRARLRASLGSNPDLSVAARNDKIAQITDLANGAIRERNSGNLQSARSLYGAALAASDGDAALAGQIQGYVERGTGMPISAWYGDAPAAKPAPAAALDPGPPPENVGGDANGDIVFVCDGPIDAPQVSCREIQQDGKQCLAVMAFETQVNWRDSTTTPCSDSDLSKFAAFRAWQRKAAAAGAASSEAAAQEGPGALSSECRSIIQDYIAAAQADDGPRAVAGYEALRQAGGCGVLAQTQPQAAPSAADPRFVSRGETPMLDQTATPCDQNPAACAGAVDQLRAGTSPAAVAALYSNAIGIGLQLGSALGQGVLAAKGMSISAPQAAFRSGANGQLRGSTAPPPRALSCNSLGCVTTNGTGPRLPQSDITGIGTH